MSSTLPSLRDHEFRIFYSTADEPLERFYIPALSASVQYDRSAGFFSSTALAVAAAGVVGLIRNGGRMRLLVGAELSESDVQAIQHGHDLKSKVTERLLDRFPEPEDALLKARLEVLAWMVAEGTLDIRVVLPRDKHGLPIPGPLTADYYHPKNGIFTDAYGNSVAFTGSINESETAWLHNYETFMVFSSWEATALHLRQLVLNFERLWNGQEEDWIAFDIPEAVRQRLVKYRPARIPERDPLEKKEPPPGPALSPQAERILFQYLRDAPFLPNAIGLGAATSAITPWPHQSRVADAVLAAFPDRALFCDEVGLGKTIEAGLVLRQLLLSGRVKRCLILTPKSVLKQWQEELAEKFALQVPRYDGGRFWDVRGRQLFTDAGNPWDAFPVMLASSQLAKRTERREQILAAQGWDLLVVDEAHHARRRDFRERIYRPNRLLGLLDDINERQMAGSLLLLTATPMQIHPLEVWDLLRSLGMGGRWGADEDSFLAFFEQMRQPFSDADWELVFDLVQDYLRTGGQLDQGFAEQVRAEIGPVKWAVLEGLASKPGTRAQALKQLGVGAQPYVKEMARLHTPLRRYLYRNTRSLLREYQKRGILKGKVPFRRPRLVRIPMRDDEQTLYERIDEYISQFYQKYENERRGLGFVMTVYRRRLTSSFWAVRCSLERRMQYLRGQISAEEVFTDDDTEEEELTQDWSEEILSEQGKVRFETELDYVEDFVRELKSLSSSDSKLERLKEELAEVFRQRTKALVYTQYTDTMDYVRDQLRVVYGTRVACYSGRGGEVWTGINWVETTKEQVKNDFRDGKISVLVCTEAASEGLNLQTCGVLINYDMPWNPMRVEQRIGRIDRIGQDYDEVWISNYFYQDTIEDLIYQRLADRIDWFEVVVGDLQPILAEVGEATRRLAMLPASEREAQLEKEIDELKKRLQNREFESLNLDEFSVAADYKPPQASPVTLKDLERLLTQSQATRRLFQAHAAIPDSYVLEWNGESRIVTFSPACFDEHPNTVEFLSYGHPLLGQLLASVRAPEPAGTGTLLRLCSSNDALDRRAWYGSGSDGSSARIESLSELEQRLKGGAATPAPLVADAVAAAEREFTQELGAAKSQWAEALRQRRVAQALAERARAQRHLVKAALVELALGQQATMLDSKVYPAAFNSQAILGLGRRGYPWGPLLKLAYDQNLRVDANDAFYQKIQADSRESLKGRFAQLEAEAKKLVHSLNRAMQEQGKAVGASESAARKECYGL